MDKGMDKGMDQDSSDASMTMDPSGAQRALGGSASFSTAGTANRSVTGPERLTMRQVRRIALRSQGFAARLPSSMPAADRRVERTLEAMGLVQMDSVTTLVRSHYLPFFSRLGEYSTARLDGLQRVPATPRGALPRATEFWAHEASIVPVELFPHLRALQNRVWVSASDTPEERDGLIPQIVELLAGSETPLTVRQMADVLNVDSRRDRGHWGWNWAPLKHAVGDLFQKGVILSAGRTPQFERLYVPWDRVVRPTEAPSGDEAADVLTERALKALGVARTASIADYYRLSPAVTRAALARLEAAGRAVVVDVEGERWWKHPEAKALSSPAVDTLLSPFDPLVFHRPRLREVWAMEFKLEFYVPEAKRVYGYYVMPFLQGDRMSARVDVQLDRAARALIVKAAYPEECSDDETAARLAAACRRLARWLGAGTLTVLGTSPFERALQSESNGVVDW